MVQQGVDSLMQIFLKSLEKSGRKWKFSVPRHSYSSYVNALTVNEYLMAADTSSYSCSPPRTFSLSL